MIFPGKEFIEKIFWIQNQIQANHWAQPVSGFKHEVLGKFYSSMNSFCDQLVETYGGLYGKEAIRIGESLYIVKDNLDNLTMFTDILNILTSFREEFKDQPALVNVIDDMLTETARNKYLIEFN